MNKFSFKALILGFLVDMVGSFIAGVALVGGWAAYEISQGVSAKTVSSPEFVQQHLYTNLPLLFASVMIGLFFTILGGAITGWLSPAPGRLFNAALLGIIEVLLGLLMGGRMPLWYNVTGVIITIPASLAGAFLVKVWKKDSN